MTLMTEWLKLNKVGYANERYFRGYHWYGVDIMETAALAAEGQAPIDYRRAAIRKFGFAILDDATVSLLLPYGPFLEIGAGTGYWAYELRKAGADIIATDPDPMSGLSEELATTVRHGEVVPLTATQALAAYGAERTLLTVWPSYDESWPALALEEYTRRGGERVVYVGEGHGGCTADDTFHELLEESWGEVLSHDIPQWWGIHDTLTVYERKK